MPGTMMPPWRQAFYDNNGDPLASGTVETYETGTTTPLATYSNEALTVSNGTSFTLNAGGFPQVSGSEIGVFLLPRAYRFILKNSAGTTLRTIDGVYALQAAAAVNLEVDGVAGEALSAGDWVYQSDGSGALTAGRWYRADADLVYGSLTPNIGFVPTAIASGGTGTIRRGGVADGLSALTVGSTYYISATAGAITATAPTNARAVGVARSATAVDMDTHWSTSFLERVLRVNAVTDYTLTLPADDGVADEALTTNGAGALSWAIRSVARSVFEGRLTLTTAVPVTVADVTAATTVRLALYKGNRFALYTGTAWTEVTLAELSIAVPATTDTMYDVFLDYNAGTPVLAVTAWTNDTTRATALTTQNGVLVQTGNLDWRFVGCFRTTGVSGQTEDSFAKRHCINYYNRVKRPMRVLEATNTWTYSTATLRQANASTANQLDFLIGVAEVELSAQVLVGAAGDSVGDSAIVGIGLDSTTTLATGSLSTRLYTDVANQSGPVVAALRTYPAIGRHTAVWLEWASAATVTFFGDNGGTVEQSGISGSIDG